MSHSISTLLGQIADEFAERCARGETPQAEEFASRYPEHADTLVQVLPLILALSHRGEAESSDFPRIAGYEILGELGRGGMGVVYEARQERLNRIVALKQILPGLLGGEDWLRRFLGEARLTARIQHPNVVALYELGESEGRPYLTMERIHGRALNELLEGQPQTARWSAEIVRKLAAAIQYAHDQGVVHRDLKPGNVLIDSQAQPHVTDFGLARLLNEDSQLTGTGIIVGSPSYLSPEQARGQSDVGPLADVYALGAILYECLTGRPPFVGIDRLDTLLLVRESEPVPLRQLNPKIPRDLEIITLKCLSKEPGQRYALAGELEADLQRFLEGQPIRARPIGWIGRLYRWARRRPTIAALSFAVVVAVSLSLVGFTWLGRSVDLQRQTAEQNFSLARKAVDDCFSAVTEHPDLQGPGMQPAREVLLRTALKYYRDFLSMREHSPELRKDLSEAYYRVGIILGELGSWSDAIDAFGRAHSLFEDPERQAACLHHRGKLYFRLERMADAERDLLLALQIRSPSASSDDARAARAASLAHLGMLYRGTSRPSLAETHLREAVQLGRAASTEQLPLVHHLLDLSRVLNETKKKQEMHAVIEEAIKHAHTLVQRHPNRADCLEALARSHRLMGSYLLMNGGTPQSMLDAYQRALPHLQRLVNEHPRVVGYQVDMVALLTDHGLAHTLEIPPRSNEALACYDRAEKLCRRLIDQDPDAPSYRQQLADLFHKKAILYARMRQTDQAEATYREVLVIHRHRRQLLPQSNQVRIDLINTLLSVAQYAGRRDLDESLRAFAEAEQLLDEVKRIQPDHPDLDWLRGILHSGRAAAYVERGRPNEALSDWQRCILPGNVPSHVSYRLRGLACRAAVGDYLAATTEAGSILSRLRSSGARNYYEAIHWFHGSRVFAQASAQAAHDPHRPLAVREKLAERYAARSLEILEIANRLGVFDRPTHVDDLRSERDFASMRERPDFLAFLSSFRVSSR